MSITFRKNVFRLRTYTLLRIIKQHILITFGFFLIYAVLIRFTGIFLKRKIIFIHASSGDLCLVASLLDAYARQNGPVLIIHSAHLTETFKTFCESSNCSLAPCRETYCLIIKSSAERIKNCLKDTPFYWFNPCTQILFGQLGMYPHLQNLVLDYMDGVQGGISHLSAVRRIFSLPIDEMPKRPRYTSANLKVMRALLCGISSDLTEIALISPVCYTHPEISREIWGAIALALNECGYKVVFNIEKNFSDTLNQTALIPSGFLNVRVPLHLLPLAGSQVGIVCGRHGGGFFIAACLSDVKKTLLIQLDSTYVQENRRPDPTKNSALCIYEIYGMRVSHFIELSRDDPAKVAYLKVLHALGHLHR